MLELLSGVLREVLDAAATQETMLAAEMDFVKRYLAIEEVRFSDRPRVRIDLDPAVARARAALYPPAACGERLAPWHRPRELDRHQEGSMPSRARIVDRLILCFPQFHRQ
jgi:Histidine kinase